jgi:hypothetical protein
MHLLCKGDSVAALAKQHADANVAAKIVFMFMTS